MHFVNNEAPQARDKLWKLRSVVDVLQARFLSGWSLPSKSSFDEGVLPATSKRNTTRMFMPDRPRRYGSSYLWSATLSPPIVTGELYYVFKVVTYAMLKTFVYVTS